MRLSVESIGFAAPGLVGWPMARECLAGNTAYRPEPLPKLSPEGLPANERRRLSTTMRLALAVAGEAQAGAPQSARQTATVFASGNGDGDIINAICEELARPDPAVSPTQFHNSVHNAPAGYWSIAARAMTPHTAVAAHDATFAAGLLEAATMTTDGMPVLLVAYDRPLPVPLNKTRPGHGEFACALLLNRQTEATPSGLSLRIESGDEETTVADPLLEELRRGNPAARALPLLAALAGGGVGTEINLPYVDGKRLVVSGL
ncbi:MAG TPA: beta-ketoacyl synthase chain length factor [Gammaproteobacteria bacterium]|nr:beta-ketoacyl synthase chain length factor [Gammaproteobacteria bacterium]